MRFKIFAIDVNEHVEEKIYKWRRKLIVRKKCNLKNSKLLMCEKCIYLMFPFIEFYGEIKLEKIKYKFLCVEN